MIDPSVFKDLWFQILATVLGTFICLTDGMVYGWTSPMIPYFTSNSSHIPITHNQVEWFETLMFMGSMCGLPGSVLVVDFFGRRGSTIIAAVLGAVCWILILCASNIIWIYVARFFLGMAGNMCFISVPMYIAEISDHRIRGFLSAFSHFMMLIGIVVVYITGSLCPFWVSPTIGIALSIFEIVVFPFMPESPYYYLYKHQEEKARNALRRLRPDVSKAEQEFREIKKAIQRQMTEKGRLKDLLMIPSNRGAVLITLLLNTLKQFIGNSVMSMNLHFILEAAGSHYMKSSTAAIIFALIMLLGAGLASTSIDRFGRKTLLIISAVLTGIALILLAVYFHLKNSGYDIKGLSWIPVACVMAYAATFKSGMGTVPIVIAGEIFPTTVKAMGMPLAELFYDVAGAASISAFSLLTKQFGIQFPFYLFSFCSFMATILIYFYVPETKGKTLEEIQLMLKEYFPEKPTKEQSDKETIE